MHFNQLTMPDAEYSLLEAPLAKAAPHDAKAAQSLNQLRLGRGKFLYESGRLDEAERILSLITDWNLHEYYRDETNRQYHDAISRKQIFGEKYSRSHDHGKSFYGALGSPSIDSHDIDNVTGLLNAALNMYQSLRKEISFPLRPLPPFHRAAARNVGLFIEQYPLSFYGCLSKCYALAFHQKHAELLRPPREICEMAIGEGSLSRHLFAGTGSSITGVELSPYSLKVARSYPHLGQAIVGDSCAPPLAKDSFHTLCATHFLHHVTAKTETLRNWGDIAGDILFNDCTPHWLSAFPHIYESRKAGRQFIPRLIELEQQVLNVQDIVPLATMRAIIAEAGLELVDTASAFSERTMYLSKKLLGDRAHVVDQPTAAILLSQPLRSLVLTLTRKIATALIIHDAQQKRETDGYAYYRCRRQDGTSPQPSPEKLRCPDCLSPLPSSDADITCPQCGSIHALKDGLRFLLPQRDRHIAETYDPTLPMARTFL